MCQDAEPKLVELDQRILERNVRTAEHNREHFLEKGVYVINVMGSPGSGKTAVLEATARACDDVRRVAALAGDLATDNDAARLTRAGMRSAAIETVQACHLDAEIVHRRLHGFDLTDTDYLFIENVGNLVCPAVYDLGQHANVVVLSVTEGEDKPLKYPTMFARADLVLLTKTDLLPHLPQVSIPAIRDSLSRVMPHDRVIAISPVTGEGVEEWLDWMAMKRIQMLVLA